MTAQVFGCNMLLVSNRYLVVPTCQGGQRPITLTRVRAYGALLGGGLPLAFGFVIAGLAGNWVGGLVFLYPALIGAGVGAWLAPGAATTSTPIRTALWTAVEAAFIGTVILTAIYTVFTVAVDRASGVFVIAFGLPIGMIIGTVLAVPVSLISVCADRRFVRGAVTPIAQ